MELFQQAIESMTETMPPLAFPIGKTTGAGFACMDLAKAPHILFAGTTGSGKSVGLNVGISTIMLRAKGRVRFHMIDPKRVELSHYADSAAVETVVTDMDEAAGVIEGLVGEMDYRYELMLEAGVKNIEAYLDKTGEKMPYEILVVDELGDLMDTHSKRVLPHLIRLGQLARAAGIHMMLATQRPAADTVPKRLLANIPSRIAYRCQSHTESRLVIGEKGAEELKGNGDLLAQIPDRQGLTRAQGPFISDEEIAEAVRLSESAEYSTGDEELEIEDIDTEEDVEDHAAGMSATAPDVATEDAKEAGRLVAEALNQAREAKDQEHIDDLEMSLQTYATRIRIQEETIESFKADLMEREAVEREHMIRVGVAEARVVDAHKDAADAEVKAEEARMEAERADRLTMRFGVFAMVAVIAIGGFSALALAAYGMAASATGIIVLTGVCAALVHNPKIAKKTRRSSEQRHPDKYARAGVNR